MQQVTNKSVLKDIAVSSTNVVYSDWISTLSTGYSMVVMHIWWTGTPTGTLEYQASCDDTIDDELVRLVGAASDGSQGERTVRGASSAAKYVDFTVANFAVVLIGTANPAGAASGQMISLPYVPAYYRLKYTNASGTGVLNARLVG